MQRTDDAGCLECGIEPITLGPKEALAIMNGTAAMTGLACLAFQRAAYLLELSSRITALAVPPFLNGPDGNTQLFRVAAGEVFGTMYGERWIRTADQLATTLAAKKLSGAATDYVVNQEGYYVRASAIGTAAERPLKAFLASGSSLQTIGDVNPDFNASLNNTMQWKGLSVNTLFNWVKGGNIYNLTRQWPFNEERDPIFDQRGKPQADKKPVNYYKVFYNGINANDFFVEDGSYVRLRELSVNYALPASLVQTLHLGAVQIGLSGSIFERK